MFKRKDEVEGNGRQAEEIAMMPKRGWGSDGKVHPQDDQDLYCGAGSCRPSFLQRFSGIWTFTIFLGLSSVGSEFVHTYLKMQQNMIQNQFKVPPSTTSWMVYSAEIACILSAVFLSIFARRVHIPRALAISSLICGVASILCVIPYAATKGDLMPAPVVTENKSYSIERYQMMVPSCIENKKAMEVVQKLMMEAAMAKAQQSKPRAGNNVTPKPTTPIQKKPETTIASVVDNANGSAGNLNTPKATDAPPISESLLNTTQAPKMKTLVIPIFKKLATHENYPMFVKMSTSMGIDLVKVTAMDLPEQIEYVQALPPSVKAMLPNLKMLLGDDPDSYFMEVQVPDTGSERRKRSVRKSRVNLETDLAYTGKLVKLMTSLSPEIIAKAVKELCPFNDGPFLVNSSTGVLNVINFAMVLQGIARGPRIAYGITFLSDNTKDRTTALHLSVVYGITLLGPLISLMLSFYANTQYITLEDVGFMTFFNPRWLGAWWLGFIILALFSFIFALPLLFFPRKLKSSNKYTISDSKSESSCFSVGGYIQELLSSLFRLVTNPVYSTLILTHLLNGFVWIGLMSALVVYVTHQFSLEPLIPGVYLLLFVTFIGALGIFLGGMIATKFKFSSMSNLKFALGLSVALIIIQACHIGLGCAQPPLDKGNKIVSRISNDTLCGSTCPCLEMVFSPGCGSDGRTYHSPCHAGCGEGYDGKFHDCKCVEDEERTLTPGYCPECDLFYPFCIFFCLGSILVGIQYVPLLIATYRSVNPTDVPLGMGLMLTLIIIIVAILSPVAYSTILDGQCLQENPKCGLLDPCVLYDIESSRHYLFGLSLALQGLAALFLLVAFLLGRKSSVYHEQFNAKEHVKS